MSRSSIFLPLSSQSASISRGPDKSTQFSVKLSQPLEINAVDDARVYLHNLTCTNSFANVHGELYDNNQLVITYGSPAVTKTFTVPDGAYTVERLEQVIHQLFWEESGATAANTVENLNHNIADATSFVRVVNASLEAATSIGKGRSGTYLADPFLEASEGSAQAYTWPQAASQASMLAAQRAGDVLKYKILSIEADFVRNRIALMGAMAMSVGGSLVEKLLGFDNAISTPVALTARSTAFTERVLATQAANFDSARSVAFHCPSLVGGGYSTTGQAGGGTLATVPIDVSPGAVLSWEASVPIYQKCTLQGGSLNTIHFYLSNEAGEPVDTLGDTFEAVIVIETSNP